MAAVIQLGRTASKPFTVSDSVFTFYRYAGAFRAMVVTSKTGILGKTESSDVQDCYSTFVRIKHLNTLTPFQTAVGCVPVHLALFLY